MCLIQFLVREPEGGEKQKYFRIFQLNRKKWLKVGKGRGKVGPKDVPQKSSTSAPGPVLRMFNSKDLVLFGSVE